MKAKDRYTPPPPTANAARRARAIQRAWIYAGLIGLLLFVQLPLLWMILTAFKQRGQATRMTFLPSARVVGEAPYQFDAVGDDPPGTVAMPAALFAPREFLWREAAPDGSTIYHLGFALPPATAASVRAYDAPARYVRATRADTGAVEEISEERARALQSLDADSEEENPYVRFEPARREPSRSVALALAPNQDALFEDPAAAAELPAERRPGFWTATLEVPAGEAAPKELFVDFERTWGQGLAALYTTENFRHILTDEEFNFGVYFLNSLLVAAGAAALTALICSLAAFAFSRKKFAGSDALFYGLLATMLIPGMIFMVPQFAITIKLGWMNSYPGMVVPHLGNVFGLFLLKQHMDSLPGALFQAARIDGANDWQVFSRIVAPLSLPIIVTLFLLVFVGQWSNFLWQFIINTSDSSWLTLPVGLQSFRGQFATRWELIMAGACFSIVPIAVLFIAVQRYFLVGMTAGSVKE